MININEITQATDIGTHKKSSLPILQVKFKDYNTAKEKKNSVWDLISTTLAIPKNHISVDDSHLDKHTQRYSRPLTVSYNLSSGEGVLGVDKNIALRGIEKCKKGVSDMEGVTKVWDLVSNK